MKIALQVGAKSVAKQLLKQAKMKLSSEEFAQVANGDAGSRNLV